MIVNTLQEAVAGQAHRHGATVTFGTSAKRESLSYPAFAEQIAAAAGGFAQQGVRPGDRVMLRISSSREGVLALLGLMHLGAVPVSVKPRVPGAILGQYFARVMRQQNVRHAFRISGHGLNELRLVLRPRSSPEPSPGDRDGLAFVQYTSGSTGMPRPIPLSHRAVLGNIDAISVIAGMKPGHAGLIALPLHHDMGLIGVLTSLVQGIDLVVEEPGTFLRRPMAALRLLRDAESVHSAFPDFMLRYLAARMTEAAAGQDAPDTRLLSTWSTVFCGAEPIRPQSVRTFLDAVEPWGFDPTALVFCYGLAEAALMATSHRYVDAATGFRTDGPTTTACLGSTMPGLDLRIVDESGRDCADGEVGAVQLRGATLFDGYDGATDHRATWFDTGDLGCLRSGHLHLSGRRGDRISVNGANVFATDVEQVAATVPGVAECVVLPYAGSYAVVIVPERAREIDTDQLAALVATEFGAAPERVVQVTHSAVARTASGKPARTHMVAQLEQGTLG
ncbi:AMP-binding protein [Streptomyces sp. C11-1]|uniref:AMP-binding protein n=1 Tax=Streptomyces durocortorensis TaxID=2811104 RepID=A0ABY9VN95_9ACTN|nr:AMP-binding protein [Streptomyces durocortorensis]WNF25404.1 AMP-binding protein [Streptomyces durocortorensis]